MKIRTLDWDWGEETLEVFTGGNGDVYVQINDNKTKRQMTVRIGGCGSGQDLPSNIRKFLFALAAEFKKYEDCKNEKEAARKEKNEQNSKQLKDLLDEAGQKFLESDEYKKMELEATLKINEQTKKIEQSLKSKSAQSKRKANDFVSTN